MGYQCLRWGVLSKKGNGEDKVGCEGSCQVCIQKNTNTYFNFKQDLLETVFNIAVENFHSWPLNARFNSMFLGNYT